MPTVSRRRPAGLLALLLCLGGWLTAAVALAGPASADRRVALVIGNAAYTHASALTNPGNDAGDMAGALKSVGVEVILGLDLDKLAFDAKIREFSRALTGADTAILFYAGHGLQVGNRNYLIPVDAQLKSERDLEFEAVALDFIMRQMEIDREGKTNLVFLDACRDNPLARSLARAMGTRSIGVGKGLAEVQAGVGTFVAYSTKPGDVALDGAGRNSPFAAALVKAVKTPGRGLTAIMIDVRKDVLATTAGKQVPWDHSALTGDFYFTAGPGPLSKIEPVAPPKADADSEAMQARIQQLEDDLKRKADPQVTVKLVELSQMKDRLRQLEEANRGDQNQIFETYKKYGPTKDPGARMSLNKEVGAIQTRIVQRGMQQKKLREDIAKLEAEVGPSLKADAGK
jgi:uncharacterized caspase-like protein